MYGGISLLHSTTARWLSLLGCFVGSQRGNTFPSETSGTQDRKFLPTHLPCCVTRAASPADPFPAMQIWEDTALGNHLHK